MRTNENNHLVLDDMSITDIERELSPFLRKRYTINDIKSTITYDTTTKKNRSFSLGKLLIGFIVVFTIAVGSGVFVKDNVTEDPSISDNNSSPNNDNNSNTSDLIDKDNTLDNYYTSDNSSLDTNITDDETLVEGIGNLGPFFLESNYKNYKNDFVIPDSHFNKLTFSILDTYTPHELYIARNEIFARHGYIFSNTYLDAYFSDYFWYDLNPYFEDSDLTEIEKYNINYILATETVKKAARNCSYIYDDYVIPDSDIRLITSEELKYLNDWEIYVAKNEIYARYGLEFSITELANHFESKYWYYPDKFVDNNVQLTSIEYKNVSTILKEEEIRNQKLIQQDW